MRGTLERREAVHQAPDDRQHVRVIVAGRQRPHPAVEDLDRLGARPDLRGQRAQRDVREPVQQPAPGDRVAHHQRPRARLVLGGAALDEVAGERERAAREADQRNAQLGAGEAHRLFQPRRVGGGLEWAQPAQIASRPHRLGDHRAHPGPDLDADADRLERGDDVGEEDRRVDAVTADRLQRHLGRQLGRVRDLHQRRLLADRPVLGKRSPGLAHEPDRHVVGLFAAQRAQQRRVGCLPAVRGVYCERPGRHGTDAMDGLERSQAGKPRQERLPLRSRRCGVLPSAGEARCRSRRPPGRPRAMRPAAAARRESHTSASPFHG